MGTDRYKVLMIGPDRSVHGGISGVVNNYYEAGLDRRIDLCYIGTMVEGSGARKLLQAVKAYLLFLVRLPRYRIVHVNMASDTSFYRKSVFIWTAKLFRKKLVIHQHGGNFPDFYGRELHAAGKGYVRRTLGLGDAFLVLGTAWKDFFGEIIGREKITVLPDAVELPAPYNKQYGGHKLLFLGRLCGEKGIGELLSVIPRLRNRFPDAHLYLGGIWADEALKERARSLGTCVTDLGWIGGSVKQKYLRECDIFVMPSHFEGQSVSILEAMANECAIAASDTGGIPDMIVDGQTGLLVPPKDAAALEERLLSLLADPGLCQSLGKKAREKVAAAFSMEQNIEQLLAVYRAIAGDGKKQAQTNGKG